MPAFLGPTTLPVIDHSTLLIFHPIWLADPRPNDLWKMLNFTRIIEYSGGDILTISSVNFGPSQKNETGDLALAIRVAIRLTLVTHYGTDREGSKRNGG